MKTESDAVIARFLPDSVDPCNSVLPFPTDISKDPVTGLLNVPFCMDDDASTTALKTGLRTLDGYSLNVTITVPFSRPINPDTAADAITILAPDGSQVPFTPAFLESSNLLVIQPNAPLQEATQYVVIVDNGITDTSGQPVVGDQIFTLLKSQAPLIDEKGYTTVSAISDAQANGLEPLRQAFGPIFGAAAAVLGKQRGEIVSAFAFTTQSGYSLMTVLDGFVQTLGGATAVHETSIRAADHLLVQAAGIPVDEVCALHTGHMEAQSFLTPTGTFGLDDAGQIVTGTTSIDYMLATPKNGAACDTVEPWNPDRIAVFVHALGRCKNDAIAIANAFAAAGYATVAIDAPRSGARAVGNLGDQDLDGCPDSPATPEFVVIGNGSPNPFGIRDRLRQHALEIGQLVTELRTNPWTLAGQDAPASPGPTRVVLAGHSWGGMSALLAAPLGDGVDAIAVNAVSGEMGAIFAPLVEASTAASMPDASQAEIAAAVQTTLAAFQWATEPGDPLYATGGYSETLPTLFQIVSAGNEDVSLHAKADQIRLADRFEGVGAAQSTFTLADSEDSATFCSDASATLASLLQPCAADDADPTTQLRAGAAYLGLQRQMVTFLATATSSSAVVCSPDITMTCP